MSADWEMIVRVRLCNAMENGDPLAETILRAAIEEEGGVLSVLMGWCDAEDFEIVSLQPVPTPGVAHDA
jgi:hypothetical protein